MGSRLNKVKKAIILAAGRGSRLKKLTKDRPKCLNQVGGKSLIEWQISSLKSAGIEQIILVTGYRSDLLTSFGLKSIYNPKWEISNMVRSLLVAADEIDQPVIVSYSDIVYNSTIVSKLIQNSNDLAVTYDTEWQSLWEERFEDPLTDAESFQIDTNGVIQEIGKPVQQIEEIQGQFMGLLRFTPTAFQWIQEWLSQHWQEVDQMDMTSLLSGLIQSGYKVYGSPISKGWCEVDTESDLELANRLILENKIQLQ